MAPKKFSLFPFRDMVDKNTISRPTTAHTPEEPSGSTFGRRPLADLSTNTPLADFSVPHTSLIPDQIGISVSDVGPSRPWTSSSKGSAETAFLLPATVYSPPQKLTNPATPVGSSENSPIRPSTANGPFDIPIPKPPTTLPCSGGLTHRLFDCGHLVRTDKPEPCAPNCSHSDDWEEYRTNYTIDEMMNHFVCLQCIEADIVERDRERREGFEQEMQQAEAALGYPLVIPQRETKVEEQLLQDEQRDVDDLVEAGRPCFPIYEGSEQAVVVNDVGVEDEQGPIVANTDDNITTDDKGKRPAEFDENRLSTTSFFERYDNEYEVAFATPVPIQTGAKLVQLVSRESSIEAEADKSEAAAGPSAASGVDSVPEDVTALPGLSKPKKLQKERKVSGRFWRRAGRDIHKWF